MVETLFGTPPPAPPRSRLRRVVVGLEAVIGDLAGGEAVAPR